MSPSFKLLLVLGVSAGFAVWIVSGRWPGCPPLYDLYDPVLPASIHELVESSDVIVEGREVDPDQVEDEVGRGAVGPPIPVGPADEARSGMRGLPLGRPMREVLLRVDRIVLNDGSLRVGDVIPVRQWGFRYKSARERFLDRHWPFERSGPSRLYFLNEDEDGMAYGSFFGDFGRYDVSGLLASADSCSQAVTSLIYDDHWTARGFVTEVEDTIAQRSFEQPLFDR